MGRTKKINYTDGEKKGLSQARNLGTDRLLRKIKEHADITDHKVFVNFLPTWNKGVSRVWLSDNWGDTAPLRHDGRGNLEAANGGFPTLEQNSRPQHTRDADSGDDLPGSQTMQLKPPAATSNKKDKQKMKTVCEKCFTAKGTKDDLFPGVPWLRCGVAGCKKINIHSCCSYIKLVNDNAKSVTNFCQTFVRCQSHFGELVASNSESESDGDFQQRQVKRSKPKPTARAVKTPGSFLLDTSISEDEHSQNNEQELEVTNMNISNSDPWANFHPADGEYTNTDVTESRIQNLKKNIFSVPRKPLQINLGATDKITSSPGQGSSSGHVQSTSSNHVQLSSSGHRQSTSSGHGLSFSSGHGQSTSSVHEQSTSSGDGLDTSSSHGVRISSGLGQWPSSVQRLGTSLGSRLGSKSGQKDPNSGQKGPNSGQNGPNSGQKGSNSVQRKGTSKNQEPSISKEKVNWSGQDKGNSAGQRMGTSAGQNLDTSHREGKKKGLISGHRQGISSGQNQEPSIGEVEVQLPVGRQGTSFGERQGTSFGEGKVNSSGIGHVVKAVGSARVDSQTGSVKDEKKKVKPIVLKLKKKPKFIE